MRPQSSELFLTWPGTLKTGYPATKLGLYLFIDALLYLAYLQVFEDCDRTDDCRANALADSWDYLEGSGISNNQPYSCRKLKIT